MNILEEVSTTLALRNNYLSLYNQQIDDIKEGKLPKSEQGESSMAVEARTFMKLYAATTYLFELSKLALKENKEGSIFLEQDKKETLEDIVEKLPVSVEEMEKNITQRLYQGESR